MVPGSLSTAQLMFVPLSQPLQNYAYDCSIFGSWHICLTVCFPAGKEYYVKDPASDLCLLTCTSPLSKLMTLVDEHEIISDNLLCFQDTSWISDFLRT